VTRAGEEPARVVLGRIAGAHGSNGALRVRWLGDGPENLMRAPRVAIGSDVAHARWYEVRRCAPATGAGHGGEVRIEVEGVESREAAGAFAGLLVIGESAQLEALPSGEHYWFEWIGCAVSTDTGIALGTVKELWDAGAHDVLVVREETTGRERLLPVVQALLREVDIPGRRIVTAVPEGLLEEAVAAAAKEGKGGEG
jgi:16S rRNA processing protein RimM